jgi:hypothetical protein
MAKKYGKHTQMWQLYESLFLDDERPDTFNEKLQIHEPAVTKIPCESHGKALNLAMGLNACQMQAFEEAGTPKHWITKSAKAKQDEHGDWYLEISVSYRHRSKPGDTTSQLGKLLAQVQGPQTALGKLAALGKSQSQEEVDAMPRLTRPPVDDSLFESMFDLHLPKPKEKDE